MHSRHAVTKKVRIQTKNKIRDLSLATVHIPEIKGKMSHTNGSTQQWHRDVVTYMLTSALQHVYFPFII